MVPCKVKALVLAAGLGTRLKPITDEIPKCLVQIAGRSLLDYWVDKMTDLGVSKARINTHAHAGQVSRFIAETNRTGQLALTEFYEPTLLGSAGTVSANIDLADGSSEIIIIYADNLSAVNLNEMLTFHRSHEDPITILLYRAPNPHACGIVELDRDGRVVSFEEKPKSPKGDLANGGIYIVSPEAYREMAAMNAFDLGTDVLPHFVGRMRGWYFDGYHCDIGTHEALAEAEIAADCLALYPRKRKGETPAVFLDRDGTLIDHVHYLSRPEQVRLVPGACEAIQRLKQCGYATVVVTNQSVVGQGLITEADLHEIHDEMNRQLAEGSAALDAIYYCTVAGSGDDRTLVEHPDRKPGPGMLLRAALEHGLDIEASWMVGDMISDVLAGQNAGCRGQILIRHGVIDESNSGDFATVLDLTEAVNIILQNNTALHEVTLASETRR